MTNRPHGLNCGQTTVKITDLNAADLQVAGGRTSLQGKPVRLIDGRVDIPSVPGLGGEVDRAVVEEFRIDR